MYFDENSGKIPCRGVGLTIPRLTFRITNDTLDCTSIEVISYPKLIVKTRPSVKHDENVPFQ